MMTNDFMTQKTMTVICKQYTSRRRRDNNIPEIGNNTKKVL